MCQKSIIDISTVQIIPEFITRSQIVDPETVARYRDLLDVLPPIKVWQQPDTGDVILLDGRHTLEANLAENHRETEVLFAEGDYIEALVQSRKSNLGHGLPYTRTEWRQAVMDIVKIRHPRSNAWIAREIGCSPVTVGRVRVELEEAGEIPVLEYLEAENGRMIHRQARDEKNDPTEVAEAEAELPEEIAAEEMAEEEEVEETEAGRKAGQEGKAQESPEQGEDISGPEREPDPGDPIKMALKLARLGEPLAVEVGLWLEGEQHPILTTLLIATNPPKGFEEAAPEYDNCLIITEALARSLNLIFN